MALYDFNEQEAKFIQSLITMVVPQNFNREQMSQFIREGDAILLKLRRPIHAAGKPKINLSEIKGLTDEEKKVIEECT
jgi:hypothetical protein